VWLALQTFGVDAFRAAIDRAMDLTLFAQRRIEADDRLELVTPASLGVLTFRRRGAADATHSEIDRANERLVAWLAHRGDVLLTSTMIGGRYVIRLCVLNHSTGEADVIEVLDQVAEADAGDTTSEPLSSGSVAGPSGRDSGIDVSWLRAHGFDADQLRAVEGFSTVSDEQASRFLGTGREESYDAGDAVTERWAYARVFYLVLEGRLSVRIDAAEVNALGPGDYLGEIAAIDWGRDSAMDGPRPSSPQSPRECSRFRRRPSGR